MSELRDDHQPVGVGAHMTPLASWLLFLVCIAVGVTVYVVVAGGGRYRRIERQALGDERPLVRVAPILRVFGGVYDHEARGDFDRPLTFDHDPLTDDCEVCSGRRRRAFNRIADRPGSPRDADELMAAIREELES
jgi:hypothetical protein